MFLAERFGVSSDLRRGIGSLLCCSNAPSLPLRTDPVASVVQSCVGCGLCGEVAHAAVLCPSFYRAETIRNPNRWDRALYRLRRRAIAWLGGAARAA